MPSYDRALHALRSWLDTGTGIGHVAVGMARQGYDLQLSGTTRRAGGSTVRQAAWEALRLLAVTPPRESSKTSEAGGEKR
jgi:hypothetical protein